MIASRAQSTKHGSGRLVVDGCDDTVVRKATFAFRPSKAQAGRLHGLLRICCEVYNAALQERRDAWRLAGKTVRWQDQFVQSKHLRGIRDDALVYGIQPLPGAIMRVDEAVQGFFDRRRPAHPVSPRDRDHRATKSARRQLARMVARGGRPVTLTVTRRRAGTGWVWRATVAFVDIAVEPTTPTAGNASLVGADRGVKVTLASSDGQMLTMPRHVSAVRQQLVELERAQARKVKFSREWRRLGRHIGRLRRKAANQVNHWARETANGLVAGHAVIALEGLELASMTRSASGSVEQPGTNVAQKQGLNRELQDAALGKLATRVCVKAESAGRRVWLVAAANTSRACSRCGYTNRSNRPNQATFRCLQCGFEANADINAAVNIATRGRQCEQAWQTAGAPPLPRRRSPRRPRTKHQQHHTRTT